MGGGWRALIFPRMQVESAMEPAEAMESAKVAEEPVAGEQNRRTDPRYDVDEEAHLLLVEHGSTLACRIVDLSLNGCRVRMEERFCAGTRVRVELSFRVRGLAFRFSGLTQWTDGRHLAGIRFVNVTSRRRDDLVEAPSEVKEENARKAEELAAAKLEAEAKAGPLETVTPQAAEQAEVGSAGQDAHPSEQEKSQAGAGPIEQIGRQIGQKALSKPSVEAPARTMTAQTPFPERSLFILPSASGTQAVPRPETAVPGEGGQSAAFGLAGQRLSVQRLAAAPASGSLQPNALQKAESSLAASQPRKPAGRRERREQSREEVDTTAVIYLIKIASKLSGRILDLSLSGCHIRADERFPVGIYTRVETEFRLEGLPFRLGGVIQSIHDRHNVGIRFLDVSDRKREQVEQLIEEIRELRARGAGDRK